MAMNLFFILLIYALVCCLKPGLDAIHREECKYSEDMLYTWPPWRLEEDTALEIQL